MLIFNRLPKFFCAFVLSLSLLLSACGGTATAPPQDTGTRGAPTDVATAKPIAGSQFNRYFPRGGGEYQITFRQEKEGFAQAKLSQGGTELAMLSINDVANNASALNKFRDSSLKIAGYPATTIGNNTTALLVADRFQVKVQSKSMSPGDRETWLKKFDLNGLSQLR
jgi:hypothetical protein